MASQRGLDRRIPAYLGQQTHRQSSELLIDVDLLRSAGLPVEPRRGRVRPLLRDQRVTWRQPRQRRRAA